MECTTLPMEGVSMREGRRLLMAMTIMVVNLLEIGQWLIWGRFVFVTFDIYTYANIYLIKSVLNCVTTVP